MEVGHNLGRSGSTTVKAAPCAPELWCTRQIASGQLPELAEIPVHTGVGKPSVNRKVDLRRKHDTFNEAWVSRFNGSWLLNHESEQTILRASVMLDA